MAQMPTVRMGPPPRSFAADAHDCIMVRIQTDLPDTSLRREDAPQCELPSDHYADRRRQSRSFEEKPISLFIVPPRAQASRRCETQATLGRQAAKLR